MPYAITAWLNGNRDYDEGLELLKLHGASAFVLQVLADGPGPFNTGKLLAELQKLQLKVAVAVGEKKVAGESSSSSKSVPSASATAPATKPGYQPNHDLEKTLRIKKLIKELFKEITHLHGQLSVLPEGAELHECAKSILNKNLKRQDLWDQLHYFENNGKWFDELPENQVKDFDPKDPEQLEQKIKNLMASRSKVTKLLKKPWPVAIKAHHEKRKAEFTRQIEHLKSLR